MTLDKLQEYGMEQMSDEEIQQVLSSQSIGVLGLPAENGPGMRPMSFWFDGDATIYLVYVLGSSSRKEVLSDQADAARFLVYRADTMFHWRSVLLTGPISEVPEGDRDAFEESMEMPWRPDLFERATESTRTKLVQFEITDQSGIKHLGLPPELREESEG